MVKYQQELHNFSDEIVDLVEKYKESFPAYEVVNRLIAHGVSIAFCCAPKERVAFKTIMASIENGMREYEELHCEEKKDVG